MAHDVADGEPGAWYVPGLMEAVILGKDRCHECTEKVSR